MHDGESLTTTGEAVGTIAYMAPEQIRGASKVDERADLYAFAMVVFETLCGRLAYDANGSIALIACKLEKPARSIRDLGRMAIPAGLDALLSRCLARRPTDRPGSAAELLREWRSLGLATVAPSPVTASLDATDPATEAGLTAAPTLMTRTAKRGARVGLLVAGGALVASCGVLWAGLSLHAPPPPTAAVTAAAAATTIAVGLPAAAPSPSPSPAVPAAASSAQPAAIPASPALEVAPVYLASSTEVPEAGPPPRAPAKAARPGRRTWAPQPPPRRSTTEPQIVSEPRY